MKKILILLKLCYKFSKKYTADYLTSLAKPILFAILGILFLIIGTMNIKFIILAFLSIPFTCYAFWKGYLITYGLIFCADDFINKNSVKYSEYKIKAIRQEKEFAKYICFVAVLSLIFYVPSLFYLIKTIPFSIDLFLNPSNLLSYQNIIDNTFLINSIVLSPFLNYALCAYYFKKDNENYFNTILNCYKKLDIIGLTLAVIITLISYKGGIIYLILAILLNPFIYSINTFWYSSRVKSKV